MLFKRSTLETQLQLYIRKHNEFDNFELFMIDTTAECGASVYHTSICLFVSDPFLVGCEKSFDKILGF